jgi:type III secretory pathway component EscS
VLDRFTIYFANLFPGAQATIFGVLSLFLVFQAVRRYQEQTLIAFLLALGAIVLFWMAFAKAIG